MYFYSPGLHACAMFFFFCFFVVFFREREGGVLFFFLFLLSTCRINCIYLKQHNLKRTDLMHINENITESWNKIKLIAEKVL